MKLTSEEIAEARKRRLAYEQDMAIEGIHLEADEKAFSEQMDAGGVGYDEGIRRAKEFAHKKIRERKAALAAE